MLSHIYRNILSAGGRTGAPVHVEKTAYLGAMGDHRLIWVGYQIHSRSFVAHGRLPTRMQACNCTVFANHFASQNSSKQEKVMLFAHERHMCTHTNTLVDQPGSDALQSI